NNVSSLDSLGLAYQQRARETGDPTYYTKSDEALHRALALAPSDLLATSGLGSLALSRHRFRQALVLGRCAHAISPTTARNYGVIGDALVELGRYPADAVVARSEEHTSELQSRGHLVCRLLLDKKKT